MSVIGEFARKLNLAPPSPSSFTLNGKEYEYFYHKYNRTWRNERAVEVAVALTLNGWRVLEVGNVLNHYLKKPYHTVVDKYEKWPGVINQDICEFSPTVKYDLIISISTLEHIEGKFLAALTRMRHGLLAQNGVLFVTVPVGYNRHLDSCLISGVIDFDNTYFMRRVSKDNRWEECSKKDALNSKYNQPYKFANAIMIGIDGGSL